MFWYGRQLFVSGRYSDAEDVFRRLHERAPATFRIGSGAPIAEPMTGKRSFSGEIVRKEEGCAFIRVDESGRELFAHASDTETENWVNLHSSDRVEFQIGFNRRGARVVSIKKRAGKP